MPDPNRYHLAQYSPAELAALPDEPLLWWLVWQACGAEVKPERTEARHGINSCGNMRWWKNRAQPETDPDLHEDQCRPSLEAVLDALAANYPGNVLLDIKAHTIESDGNMTVIAGPAPSDYVAACRALLAWKRGRDESRRAGPTQKVLQAY